MGRSNICVSGDYEGLFYVDWDNFIVYDEDNQRIDEPELERLEWQFALDIFKENFTKKYPSFHSCDIWIDQQDHTILENDTFYITVADNQWSMAIQLLQKNADDSDSPSRTRSRQKRFYQNYLNGIKNCLFLQFEELGIYAGPYTHGTIQKPKVRKNNEWYFIK